MSTTETHVGPGERPPGGPIPPLVVTGLNTAFVRGADRLAVVQDLSFTLERGKTLMLLGESGSGKSVTARSVLQLYGKNADITGSVRLNGHELVGLREPELRKVRGRVIAMVPQDPTGALDPLRRIGAQIAEVVRVHQRLPRRSAATRAEELLHQVGIQDPKRVAASFPHQLSGGMRQRAVIAIAISCDPQVLIADEPTTALDVTVQKQILDLIARLRAEIGTSVLMVTHDVGVAVDYGDEVAVMYRGRLIERGPAGSVLRSPRHAYTQGLLAAQPRPGVARGALSTMVGWSPEEAELQPVIS